MSRRIQENIVVLLLLAFFTTALVMSLDFSPRARLVPVPISALAIALLVFQLVWQNVRPADELNVELLDVLTSRGPGLDVVEDQDKQTEEEAPAGPDELTQWKRIAVATGFVALLVALVFLLGPLPAIFAFTCGYFITSRHFSPARAVVYTTVFTLAIYLVFVEALQLQLYHGYLEPVADYLRRL